MECFEVTSSKTPKYKEIIKKFIFNGLNKL